jgi:hypothetical protein
MFLRFSASKRKSPNQNKENAFYFLRALKQRVAFKKRLVQCECGSGGKWQRADSLFILETSKVVCARNGSASAFLLLSRNGEPPI